MSSTSAPPPQPAAAAAVDSGAADDVEWEEEEEVEIIEGGSGQAAAAAIDDAREEQPMETEEKQSPAAAASSAAASSLAAASSASPASPSSLLKHLRHLLRPFGPLHFGLCTTLEPSAVPRPPRALYSLLSEGGAAAAAGQSRKRALEPEGEISAEQFQDSVRNLKSLPLVRVGQHAPSAAYDPRALAATMRASHAQLGDLVTDASVLANIDVVCSFLSSPRFSAAASDGHRKLWLQHDFFDPHRLLTHAPPLDAPVAVHPPRDQATADARFEQFEASAAAAAAAPALRALHLPRLSFSCAHIALAMAELDTLHSVITSPAQRSRAGIAAALAQPPPPQVMFLTFVDLSGGEGAASEYLLWKRRVCNLRGKGFAYDLSGSPLKENWSLRWLNATARDQSKNFTVFHPPHDAAAAAASPAGLHGALVAEQNIDAFMRAIDMQTKGVGVQLALAAVYASPADAMQPHTPSLSFRPNASSHYSALLFQVDTALRTLAKGGTLLLQLHETHTPFTLSLLFILFRLFDHCILQQVAGTSYASGQSFLVCKQYHHDRVAMRPSAFPVIAALRQAKAETFAPLVAAAAASGTQADWSAHSLVTPQEMRADPNFVTWLKQYNAVSHAYQLHCLLSLLQPSPLLPAGLLQSSDADEDGSPDAAALAPPSVAGGTILPLEVPPPHHRVRINMLQYLGFPVGEPFLGAAITRR